MSNTTLCYIEKDDCYLMLHRNKKHSDVNEGKWIGVGGHFEDGESPDECLLREVFEETGLTLTKYKFRGIVTFVSDKYGTDYMHLYTATEFSGELNIDNLNTCNEGDLHWVHKSDIFNLNLWEGDKIFLKLLFDDSDVFSLKLVYQGDELIEKILFYN